MSPPFRICVLDYCNGLVQERHNSSVLALELRLSCINPSNFVMACTWCAHSLRPPPTQCHAEPILADTQPLDNYFISGRLQPAYFTHHMILSHYINLPIYSNAGFSSTIGMFDVNPACERVASERGCMRAVLALSRSILALVARAPFCNQPPSLPTNQYSTLLLQTPGRTNLLSKVALSVLHSCGLFSNMD